MGAVGKGTLVKKIIPALFWILLFVFVISNVPKLLESEIPGFNRGTDGANGYGRKQVMLLNLHNENRKSKSVDPLVLDKRLCDYAEEHAGRMAKKNKLAHSSMVHLQKFCGADIVGENIAWGQETEKDVVSSWMKSPMHRWNILGSSYKKVGFGVKGGEDGRNYWCAVFSN